MAGYLPDEATADAFADGWYRTGDVGWLEPEGWVHLTDRAKEMIKVNGFQVAPAEIEAVLHGHPAVLDCAVFGLPDERAGEVPVAAVRARSRRGRSPRRAPAAGGRLAGHLQAAARRWWWSTTSPGCRRARCCGARCATSGRRRWRRRGPAADGRPTLPRTAGAARLRGPGGRPSRPQGRRPARRRRAGGQARRGRDRLGLARAAHGRVRRRTAGLWGRGGHRGRGAGTGAARRRLPRARPWPPTCADWPAPPRPWSPRPSPSTDGWPPWLASTLDGALAPGVVIVDAAGADGRAGAGPGRRRRVVGVGVVGRGVGGRAHRSHPTRRSSVGVRRPTWWRWPTRSERWATTISRPGPRSGLALTCADLVGTMRGAIELTCRVRGVAAPVRRRPSARSRRSSTCWPTPSWPWRARAAWLATPPGPSTRWRPPTRWPRPRVAKAYCARAARGVCETAIQVHGGIGNTWECLAHVYLRRAMLSSDLFGGAGANLRPRARPPRHRFGDRSWRWTSVTPPTRPSSGCGCGPGSRPTTRVCPPRRPTTSTGPAWPPGTSRCTTAASSACPGRPTIGGQELPSVYDVILDEELAAAGAPPRPSLGYLVEGILEHANEDIQPALPARHRQRARPLVPGLQRARRRLRPGLAAHPRRPRRRRVRASPATRCGRATPTTPTGAWCWPAPTTTCPSTRASRRSPCRCTSPASSSDRCG